MPVLSYVHQLFDAEQCQTYIHTLRWNGLVYSLLGHRIGYSHSQEVSR
jgi:hypothetical protein